MYRAVEKGQPVLFACLKAKLRNAGVDWTTLTMQQLARSIDEAISVYRIASKQKLDDRTIKDERAAAQAISESAARAGRGRGHNSSSSKSGRGGRGGAKGDVSNFRSRESNSRNVFGSHSKKDSERFDDALPVSDATMAAGECETCHSKDHVSNKCPQQKIVCNNYKNFKTCSYGDKCRFRHLEADDVLIVQEMGEMVFSEQAELPQAEIDFKPTDIDVGVELALSVQEVEDSFFDCLQGHGELPDLCDEAQFVFEESDSEGDVDDALAIDLFTSSIA